MTSFTKQDFPLIAIYENAAGNEIGRAHLQTQFDNAANGSIDDKFMFTFGLQTGIAWPESRAQLQQQLPDATDEIIEKTLVKCYEIFALAADNNDTAAHMYYTFTLRGIGCEADIEKAEVLLEKYDSMIQGQPEYERMIAQARAGMQEVRDQLSAAPR